MPGCGVDAGGGQGIEVDLDAVVKGNGGHAGVKLDALGARQVCVNAVGRGFAVTPPDIATLTSDICFASWLKFSSEAVIADETPRARSNW